MKRFRKGLVVLMTLAIMTVTVACGTSESEVSDNKPAENTQKETKEDSKEMLRELSATLSLSAAWDVVVACGQEQYETFSVNNSPSQPVDETAQDAETWHLKAGCIADGEAMTCEAEVTGTTENPTVLSFKVY